MEQITQNLCVVNNHVYYVVIYSWIESD